MGRQKQFVEMWVRVEPATVRHRYLLTKKYTDTEWAEYRQKEQKAECERILADIRRHVDYGGGAYMDEEYKDVCEFCGSDWTEGPDAAHNGGCCEEDEKIMIAQEEGIV